MTLSIAAWLMLICRVEPYSTIGWKISALVARELPIRAR
jgi:hypothetical protein